MGVVFLLVSPVGDLPAVFRRGGISDRPHREQRGVDAILDEPTSALDLETERRLQDDLNAFCRGRTTFIVAHRLSTFRQVERVFVFQRGRIVEDGYPEELMLREEGAFRRLHRRSRVRTIRNQGGDMTALAAVRERSEQVVAGPAFGGEDLVAGDAAAPQIVGTERFPIEFLKRGLPVSPDR